jgi:hypothetical protein
MKPEIALCGWAEIKPNGRVISGMSPAHGLFKLTHHLSTDSHKIMLIRLDGVTTPR